MPAVLELEDELGDILDKALRNAGLTEEQLAAASGIDVGRIKDAEDYRYDFSRAELQKLAVVLRLNEVGVCALGEGKYPLPPVAPLPFALHIVALPYGIGRVNAYAAVHPGTGDVLLVDTGHCPETLDHGWPDGVPPPAALLLTHWDRDHVGGLPAVELRRPPVPVYAPAPPRARSGLILLGEGDERGIAGFSVRTFRTPGHTAEHNAYLVTAGNDPAARGVLFSGDLFFAGSVGGAFFCCRTLLREARRVIAEVPADTVVAPGHGPLTTVENERRFNPFFG